MDLDKAPRPDLMAATGAAVAPDVTAAKVATAAKDGADVAAAADVSAVADRADREDHGEGARLPAGRPAGPGAGAVEPLPAPAGCLVAAIRLPVRIFALLVLVPVRLVADTLTHGGRLVRRHLLVPAGRALARLGRALVVRPATRLRDRVFAPFGRGVVAALAWLGRGAWRGLSWAGRPLWAVASRTGRAAGSAVAGAVRWVWGGVSRAVSGVWAGVSWLARGVWAGVSWLVRGVWAGVSWLARGVWAGISWLGLGVRAALGWAGRGIGAWCGAAARLVGSCCRAIAVPVLRLARRLVLVPARALRRRVLSPAGRILALIGREIVDAVIVGWRIAGRVSLTAGRFLAGLLRRIFVEPVRLAYAHVLAPTGHALRDQVWRPVRRTVREALTAARQTVRQTVGAARETVRRTRADLREAFFGRAGKDVGAAAAPPPVAAPREPGAPVGRTLGKSTTVLTKD